MFELVVGEVGAILGEFDEQQDFSTLVLDAWLQSTEEARVGAFAALEGQLLAAREQYEDAKAAGRGAVRERARCRLEMGRMQRFVADLLAAEGALVEPIEPEGLEVAGAAAAAAGAGGAGAVPAGLRRDAAAKARSGSASKATGWTASRGCWASGGAGADACLIRSRARRPTPERCWPRTGAGQRHLPPARRRAGLDALPGAGLPLLRRVSDEKRDGVLRSGDEPGDRRAAGRAWRRRPGAVARRLRRRRRRAVAAGRRDAAGGLGPRARARPGCGSALPPRLDGGAGAVRQRACAGGWNATRTGCTPTTTTCTARRCAAPPRCRRTMPRAGARSSASRRSGASTAPSSTTWRTNTRCASRWNGCRRWSW